MVTPAVIEQKHRKIGTFICEQCGLSTSYDYYGKAPPFSKSIVIMEDAFVVRDPFTSDRKPLILGSHCSLCNKVICMAVNCSLFYTKRFCLSCVQENIEEFPMEIQQELAKKIKR
ncbi:cysteine-rich DPF motif domain-containing protein 1-like [Saccoglossus kowalevskii]